MLLFNGHVQKGMQNVLYEIKCLKRKVDSIIVSFKLIRLLVFNTVVFCRA